MPGAIFIRSYSTSLLSRQNSRKIPFEELLIRGLLCTIILHYCAIIYLNNFRGLNVQYNLIYSFLIGEKFQYSNIDFNTYTFHFFRYNLVVSFIAFLTAKIFRNIVHNTNLHLRYHFLSITNSWCEIFSGEFLDKPRIPGRKTETDLLYVDVLTVDGVIYAGFLREYFYSPHNDCLESIILIHTRKKEFSADGKYKFRHIKGGNFVIPYHTIKNFNVFYIGAGLIERVQAENLHPAEVGHS